jgi:small subunit ribosomal protein S12
MNISIKKLKKKFIKLKAFNKSPQKGGTCLKIFVGTPKKPNSALRKLTKILLSTKKQIIAHIPGEGHSLQKFSTVLCRGCRVRDTPGIKYRVIRGAKKYHLKGILSRVKGRSKYGTKFTRPLK